MIRIECTYAENWIYAENYTYDENWIYAEDYTYDENWIYAENCTYAKNWIYAENCVSAKNVKNRLTLVILIGIIHRILALAHQKI